MHPYHAHRWLSTVLALVIALSASGGLADEPQDAEGSPDGRLQEIIAAWQQRQDKVRSFRFSWTQKNFYSKEMRMEVAEKEKSGAR